MPASGATASYTSVWHTHAWRSGTRITGVQCPGGAASTLQQGKLVARYGMAYPHHRWLVRSRLGNGHEVLPRLFSPLAFDSHINIDDHQLWAAELLHAGTAPGHRLRGVDRHRRRRHRPGGHLLSQRIPGLGAPHMHRVDFDRDHRLAADIG